MTVARTKATTLSRSADKALLLNASKIAYNLKLKVGLQKVQSVLDFYNKDPTSLGVDLEINPTNTITLKELLFGEMHFMRSGR